ncbi:hypothetical protein QR680_014871 [Steinernema hermaphroditum]|uniref:Uncharacterized protein n=1 Tax=Steinernema hermaphroditum TaxID=289476 RepID=A0AA39ICM1_9BILA|nr:hypothetical protein QR680_014871 [Steinernema hermaphroditum]
MAQSMSFNYQSLLASKQCGKTLLDLPVDSRGCIDMELLKTTLDPVDFFVLSVLTGADIDRFGLLDALEEEQVENLPTNYALISAFSTLRHGSTLDCTWLLKGAVMEAVEFQCYRSLEDLFSRIEFVDEEYQAKDLLEDCRDELSEEVMRIFEKYID